MKKNSFSVFELLIVFTLIGIISVLGVISVSKPWEVGYKYAYSNVLNALESSVYNQMAELDKWDFSVTAKTAKELCNTIEKYSNTLDNNCSQDPIKINNYKVSDKDGEAQYIPSADTFKTPPHLILSNGVKIWIAAANNKSLSLSNNEYFLYCRNVIRNDCREDGTHDSNIKAHYYVVFADLNGDRIPNSPKENTNSLPDIVAFAVTDRFAVIPLGLPIVNKRYLTAYLAYPNIADNGGDGEQTEVSVPMTYYEAKVKAYGTYDKYGMLYSKRIVLDDFIHSYDFENRIFRESSNNSFRVSYSLGSNPKIFGLKYDFSETPTFDVDVCGQGSRIECFSYMTEAACESNATCPACHADQCEVKFLQTF